MALSIPLVEVFLLVLAVYFVYTFLKKKRDPRYPPGPPSLPIIGNILQLGSEPHKVFIEWADKYGEIFSCKMGTEDLIMLNEAKIIKDVFAEADSAGRTPNPILVSLANGNYGIVVGEGAHWEQQRRFTLRNLRDLGFGKTSMEGIVLEEINFLLKYFEKREGNPITGNRLFNGPVVNALWNIISGERQDWDGPEKPKIMQYAEDLVDAINRTNQSGLMFAPNLRHIAPGYFGWTKWITSVANVTAICSQSIAKHAKKLDEDSPQDLIDHYLIEMKKETDPHSSFYKETGEKNLTAVIPDLFLAGSETTSHTLSWLMIHLAHNQQVLKKIQEELDTVVGTGRQPSVSDRSKLPYTEATILEILRRTSVVNAGVPHRMLQEAVINGYFFPKNTTVISNIYRVHNNPKVWGDPENFRPERFLSEDGKKIVKNENLIPFSAGKRVCLGESLARDTLFLFLACIVQKYNIKPAPGSDPDMLKNVQPNDKMINEPAPFEIIVSVRN